MGLYSGGGGRAYIRNGVNVSNLMGLQTGGGLIFGGAYIRKFTVSSVTLGLNGISRIFYNLD